MKFKEMETDIVQETGFKHSLNRVTTVADE